jgi:hypothetical protein
MHQHHAWVQFSDTYREREVRQLVRWLLAGKNGSVVGLPGCGRSNLLGFLSHRCDVVKRYARANTPQLVLVPLNFNQLPSADATTLHRTLLHAINNRRFRFEPLIREEISRIQSSALEKQDLFVIQSYLQELLLLVQQSNARIAFILNYFHLFVERATPQTLDTLRGLRDSFRRTLSILVGTSKAITHLPDPDRLGGLYELLDRNVCWVGAMTEPDARDLLNRATVMVDRPLEEEEIISILELSGRFPALLKLIAHWWMSDVSPPPTHRWLVLLKEEANIQHRLTKMWEGLTQEEQFCLHELHRLRNCQCQDTAARLRAFERQYDLPLQQLSQKGVCQRTTTGWEVTGNLLQAHVEKVGPSSRGKIWRDVVTREIYQGSERLENLTPLEQQLLHHFLDHPREPQEKDQLINNLWPEKSDQIIANDLQQLVYRVRKKVDTSPPQYIITWKGRPSGYQFYPEGRPA